VEHLLAERFGNPKAGLPLEVVQNGPHGGQVAGRLGLKQQTSPADTAEVDYDRSVGDDDHPGNKVLKV
jgi:hypothetical protein